MDIFNVLVIILILLLVALGFYSIRHTVVFEYQRGLLYTRGKFRSLLTPGDHFYLRPFQTIYKVDARSIFVTIPGQEVLSADNISLKISLAASYQVTDPYRAINLVANYQEALYLMLQLNLRDLVGALPVDDLLAKREDLGRQLYERSVEKAAEIGIKLEMVNLKDIMFPGELKNIFAQVVNARKEGLASLERARGESAALRNLANAAQLLENNPNLQQLRLYQVLEKNTGNTVVLLPEQGLDGKAVKGKARDK